VSQKIRVIAEIVVPRVPNFQGNKMSDKETKPRNIGPLCHCGHGMYEHYMCGAPWEMRCYRGAACGCEQYVDQQCVSAPEIDRVRRDAVERRGRRRKHG
jgi:hypothetical protein